MSFVQVSVDSDSVSTTGADMVCILEGIQKEWQTATATKMLTKRQQYSVKKQQNKMKKKHFQAPFTLALKLVSNRFTFKPVWPNHIYYVVYRKRFPKPIRGVYTAALNRFETRLENGLNC